VCVRVCVCVGGKHGNTAMAVMMVAIMLVFCDVFLPEYRFSAPAVLSEGSSSPLHTQVNERRKQARTQQPSELDAAES